MGCMWKSNNRTTKEVNRMEFKERLEKIMPEGKLVTVPMDDGLLDGPVGGLKDMKGKVKEIVAAKPDAILGFLGPWKHCRKELGDTAYVLNLTASGRYGHPNEKVQIYTVEDALRMGVTGVAVHLNVGAENANEQLRTLGQICSAAYNRIPVMAIAYPRGGRIREDHEAQMAATAYAARVAAECGADIVKTKYLGDGAEFKEVVDSTPVPVIMAGGPRAKENPTKTILERVYECMQAGGAGVALGRNSFHHPDTTAFVSAVRGIVRDGRTVDEVVREYKLSN